jgi:phosphatidylglycerol:prolipoprotein diacylglycerol transferase
MYNKTLFLDMGLYELCIVAAILVALLVADKMGIKRGFSVRLQKLVLYGAFAAIVIGFFGAILFQAFYNYMDTGVFKITKSTGMTFYGGLLFGAAVYLIVWFGVGKKYCKDNEPVKQLSAMADIAAAVLPLAHGIGRLGCLFAGCCHGNQTDAWYGITMDTPDEGYGKFVPVQLFEAVALFAIAGVILWLYFKPIKGKNFPLLPVYMIGYGVWRFVIEFARGDSRGKTIVPFLSPSQLIAVALILGGVAYYIIWYCVKKKIKNKESVKDEQDGSKTSV